MTRAEILAALGMTEARWLVLNRIAEAIGDWDTDPAAPDSLEISTALALVGAAMAMVTAGSIAGGGEGYVPDKLAVGLSINGVDAQITLYTRAASGVRLAARMLNQQAEAGVQTMSADLAALESKLAPTADDLVAAATLKASINANRAAQTARTNAAEATAQGYEALLPALETRLLLLAQGDLTAA